VAVNDLEEMKERQNLMKYDRIWERAEKAYTSKRKIKNQKQGIASAPLKMPE
jgi:bisphosphoglycerate-independent phosphoglycerate mutase (AlkP superfamily)